MRAQAGEQDTPQGMDSLAIIARASLVNDYLLELGSAGLGEHDARPER
jgi:hypothetical protein